jgi:hypothetical protein
MLNICPVIRIVAIVAEATPKLPGSTELITALVFGEEKSPKPHPRITSAATTKCSEASTLRKTSRLSPAAAVPCLEKPRYARCDPTIVRRRLTSAITTAARSAEACLLGIEPFDD